MSDKLNKFLNRMKDVDGIHRWIKDRPEDARILCFSYHEGTHSYAWTNNLDVAFSNFMVDIYKNFLLNQTYGDDEDDQGEECECERT